jgi:hypothetical protein
MGPGDAPTRDTWPSFVSGHRLDALQNWRPAALDSLPDGCDAVSRFTIHSQLRL